MARKSLVRSDVFPYHVVARTNNREHFPIDLEQVWKIMCNEWFTLQITHKLEIQAFVLMPNHFHVILTTPEQNLDQVMSIFMTMTAKQINERIDRTGHLYGGPHFRRLITSTRYYGHVLKYVYRNPVRANLSELVEGYPFTTARGILGYSPLPFPLHYTRCGLETAIPDPHHVFSWLEWLNRAFPAEAEELIREAMKKREINELKSPTSRRPIELLKNLL